jgi:hypothetical protein
MAFSIHTNDLAPATADETNVNDATLAFSPTGAVPVGKLAILPVVWDNANTTSADDTTFLSAADTKGNTWIRAAEVQFSNGGGPQDGVLCGCLYCVITTQIETSDTITITNTVSATTTKGATLVTFNYDTSKTIAVAGKGYERIAASGAYSAAVSGLASEGHLWIGMNGMDAGAGNANGQDTTFVGITQGLGNDLGAGGTAAARAAYKIATDTNETYDRTGMHITDRATLLVAFREVAGGGPVVTRRALLGVGV